jgi:hypothetical protein
VNNRRKYLRSGWFLSVLLAGLFWGNAAKADSIISVAAPASDDLSDWFFNSDPPPPFPEELNLSDEWTSAENIATLDYWLSLVLELGVENDSSDLVSLYGSGTISSPDPNTPVIPVSQVAQTSSVSTQSLVSQTSADLISAPEPITLSLFAGGLALLGLRRTRMTIIDHGPI